jgi:hypothetical protein
VFDVKPAIFFTLLLIVSCSELRNPSAPNLMQQYIAETPGQVFIKFNSRGDFLELAMFSSVEVKIDHPSALRNAELLAISEGRKNLLIYFDEQINKPSFIELIERSLNTSEIATKEIKRQVALKLKENLILNKIEILDSLYVNSSQYDRKANLLKTTLLSENSIKKMWDKIRRIAE